MERASQFYDHITPRLGSRIQAERAIAFVALAQRAIFRWLLMEATGDETQWLFDYMKTIQKHRDYGLKSAPGFEAQPEATSVECFDAIPSQQKAIMCWLMIMEETPVAVQWLYEYTIKLQRRHTEWKPGRPGVDGTLLRFGADNEWHREQYVTPSDASAIDDADFLWDVEKQAEEEDNQE
jgi:hypothetical protein